MGFKCSSNPKWVALILRTLTPHHTNLQQITIDASYIFYARLGQDFSGHGPKGLLGLELDHLLVQLWESHSVRLKVLYDTSLTTDREKAGTWVEQLLPELTAQEIVELDG